MPTMSTGKEIEKKMEEITTQIAEEMGIPTWGVITIIIGKSCFFPFFFFCSTEKRKFANFLLLTYCSW